MTSCSSEGRAVRERRWRSCSGVARGLVMCAAILAVLLVIGIVEGLLGVLSLHAAR